jgi:hypothetical protein
MLFLSGVSTQSNNLQHQPFETPQGVQRGWRSTQKPITNVLHPNIGPKLRNPFQVDVDAAAEFSGFSQWRGGSHIIAFTTRKAPHHLPEWLCNITLVSELE